MCSNVIIDRREDKLDEEINSHLYQILKKY